MKATNRKVEVVISRVLQKVAFQIHVENVGGLALQRARFKDNLAQEPELLGYVGGHEEVKLPQGERGGRTLLVTPPEVDIAEAPNAQQGLAEVHSLRSLWGLLLQ